MSGRENMRQAFEEIAPHLQEIKSDGFQVPEGYFEDLPELVFAKIEQEDLIVPERMEQQIFFNSLLEQLVMWLQPRYAVLAFASIALLFAAVFLLTKSNSKIETLALEDLERSEVVQYIENNLDEFEEELFLLENEPAPQNSYLESVLEEIDINTLEELF